MIIYMKFECLVVRLTQIFLKNYFNKTI